LQKASLRAAPAAEVNTDNRNQSLTTADRAKPDQLSRALLSTQHAGTSLLEELGPWLAAFVSACLAHSTSAVSGRPPRPRVLTAGLQL